MITQEYLKSVVSYDTETGIFTWKNRERCFFESDKGFRIFNKKFSGKIAGNIHNSGHKNRYITIRICNKLLYAHRLAWLYVYGDYPNLIDHIDGNGLNNRIENLRSVTNSINCKNQRLKSTNSSGRIGVYFNGEINKWVAQGKINGKTTTLISTSDFDLACDYRKKYEQENGYHENHGMRK